MTEPASVATLKHCANCLQISIDAPVEEIQRVYERLRNEASGDPRKISKLEMVFNFIKTRANCKECGRLGVCMREN